MTLFKLNFPQTLLNVIEGCNEITVTLKYNENILKLNTVVNNLNKMYLHTLSFVL